MATVEQLTIEFSGKGASVLSTQLNTLSKAMNRLAARQIEATKKTGDNVKVNKQYDESLVRNHRNLGNLNTVVGKFGKQMSMMRSRMLIVAFAVSLVSKVLGNLMKQFSEYAKLNFKINAILKSTGRIAGLTAKQLDDMANSMEKSLGFSSTQIKEMQARLLTFTNITATTFKEASVAAADMAAVFGQDLPQATIQLGKALNDPIKGYTALRRIGVSFNALQVQQIKDFQEQGKIVEAQNVILAELKKEFGGAAEAATKAAYGSEQFRKAGNEAAETARALGKALQPIAYLLGTAVRGLLKWVSIVPKAIKATGKLVLKFYELILGLRDVNKEFAIADINETMGNQVRGLTESVFNLTENYRISAKRMEGWTKVSKEGAAVGEVTLTGLQDRIIALVALGGKQDKINKLLADFAKRMLNNNAIVATQAALQEEEQEAIEKSEKKLKIKMELLQKQLELGRKLTVEETTKIEQQRELTESEKEYARAIEETNKKIAGRAGMKEQVIEFFEEVSSKMLESSKAEQAAIKEKVASEIATLRGSFQYRKANDKRKKELEDDIKKRHKKDMEKAFKQQQNARILQAMMNAKAISKLSPPKLKYGGMVGGQRHSQGGTTIEAERGEFVMRREAVESIGIETMNRINQGGGAGSVNISFNGNVMSKDFIEDEAIPQIKEAIRRGADIGVG